MFEKNNFEFLMYRNSN